MDKPDDFDINDSIDDKIKKLKRDGRNYSEEALQQLLQVVNKQNIVKMNLSHSEVTIVQRLRDILIHLDDTSSDKVPEPLQKHLTSILDTYDVSLTEDTEDMRALKNYLARSNSEMEGEIISFLRNNGKLSRTKRVSVENFIKTFMDFKLSGDGIVFLEKDETLYKTINFVKNSLHNLTDVLPNIILNNVDYTNINIPRHWKLTERHNSDIKNIITTYYNKLKPFYDEETLKPLLEKIQINTKDLHLLALNTPFFSEIKNKDGSNIYSIFDYRTSSLLFRYYLLSIFTEYIALKDDTSIIVKEVIPPKEESDIISSTEVEEEATGVITAIEIVQGEKQALSEKMAKLLTTFIDILAGNKSVIDYNMNSIMERATRVKDKEKDTFTTYLGDLTEEVREVENIKKNHRLGKWGKGLQKGLYAYEGATYDEERAELEKHAEREQKLGQHDYVTDMNREIYMVEDAENERVSDEIERDANDLSQLAEDDDYGENDGDM
jgi:Uri superfamily endonuclease